MIEGTVFELPNDPELLRQIDSYEEYFPASPADSLFVRRETSVNMRDGRTLRCWVYEYNRPYAA